MAHEPPKSSPPMAGYEFPQPVGAAKVSAAAAVPARTFVLHGDGEPAVVRGVLIVEGDDAPALTLSHDYAGVEFVGLTFEADGKVYEVIDKDARVLSLEVA